MVIKVLTKILKKENKTGKLLYFLAPEVGYLQYKHIC